MRGRRKSVASIGTVSAVSTAIVALALTSPGQPTAHLDLDDSGVWVTHGSGAQIGRFNTQAQALDATLVAPSSSADVLQQAEKVVAVDLQQATMSPVDVAAGKLAGTAKLPRGAQVGLGGDALAVLATSTGVLWVLPAEGAASFDQETTPQAAKVGADAQLAVGLDGTIHLVDRSGTLTTVATTPRGVAASVTHDHLDGIGPGDALSITAVGSQAVVLDETSATLYLPDGGKVAAEGATPVLQQPSVGSATVAYATSTSFVAQPLDGSAATTRRADGRPVAPVQVAGCSYGAWSGTGQVVRDCPGTSRDLDEHLSGFDPAATLRYRVNRSNVVLNDLASGTVWLAAKNFEKVDDWELKVPENAKGPTSDAESDKTEQVDTPVKNDRAKNHPPIAKDDTFGVRPGRSVVLPVLANDVDPDGDVMVAQVEGRGPDGVSVTQAMGGDALLATASPSASGAATFRYTVDDGRGGHDTATVTLRVAADGTNQAPRQDSEPVLTVAKGTTGSIKVLPYFRDPDGDDLYLANAQATTTGDSVRFQPDGTVEFRDSGSTTGRKSVELTVSDGLSQGTVTGTLWVQVTPSGPQPPVAVGDHAVTTPGRPVTVHPLVNDTDPNGDVLALASVSSVPGAKVTPSYDGGTFEFVSDTPGAYVMTYQVTDGPSSATGVARVDVVDPGHTEGPPAAVPDTALLPSGGQTLVDVLANDSDPAGGVLVVQSVQVPADAGITVAILAHQMLRITETQHLDAPVVIRYTVSNGTESATGQVRVIPMPPPTKLQPPHAVEDVVTVHVGDVVTVPVLANDTHPNGLALQLQRTLEQEPAAALGEAFVSGSVLRFHAGSTPGTAYAIYVVKDKNGQADSAQVTFHVVGGAQNSPPKPPTVVARALSGGSVTISVPLDGTDPDGDSVRLTGIGSPPSRGTAEVTAGKIVYTAGRHASGTDTFTYLVEDARGLQATGSVQVGVAPPPGSNQPPVALDDALDVRPGRAVSLAPLANDSDPDGDRISLVDDLQSRGLGSGDAAPHVAGDRIDLVTPAKPGTYTLYYSIEDTAGQRASAAVVVTVSLTAPLLAPVAADDTVSGADVVGKTSVTVPVLANDSDPDGSADALTVTTDQPGATVATGGAISAPLTAKAQVFSYTVTDPDGLTDQAFVWLPPLQTQEPVIRPDAVPLTVRSGETLTIDVQQVVQVADGRTPRLTQQSKVKAVNGTRVVVDTRTIRFVSDDRFVGDASVSFEVTDGTGPDDPQGHTAQLVVPITVTSPVNQPPVFAGEPSVQVGAGDTQPGTVDLARFVTDPDETDTLRFATTGSAKGVHVSLEADGQASVTTDPDVAKGTHLQVPVSVSDGHGHTVPGSLQVSVVASTRPLPRANPDDVPKAHQGEPATVDVLANDSNPFEDDGTPLTIVSAVVETGEASAPSIVDGKVVVTPAATFVGSLVLRYRVADATKDPSREVDGQVTITVQGRPDTPAQPQVVEVRSHTVVLSWDPPIDNGEPITSYTVRSADGYSQECATTTCTLEGLVNDQKYTFQVAARNAVDLSDWSPASEEVRPDEKPDPPAAPTLEFGDGQLTVRWENQTYDDRSAIESVNLRISPAPADGVVEKDGVTGTEYVWTGLTNGTAYTVQVQAVNKAVDPSDWGAVSADEVPAGKPAVPAAPTVTRDSIGAQSQMTVRWVPPDPNGGELTGYEIQVLQGGAPVTTVTADGAATSQTIDVAADTTDYTFEVRAKNKATEKFGETEFSDPSSPIRAFAAPAAPTDVAATATGQNNQVQLAFTAPTLVGVKPEEVSYQYSAGNGWKALGSDKVVTDGALTNGTSYRFQVRAVATVDGTSQAGTESAASAAVTPFGPPRTPGVSASGNDTSVTLSWSDPGSNGHAYTLQISVDGGGWQTVSGNGSKTVGNGYEESHSITARTVETGSPGRTAQSGTASATSKAKPQALAASQGAHHKLPDNMGTPGSCGDASCAWVHLSITGAAPNTTFKATCYARGSRIGSGGYTADVGGSALKTDGSGNYSGDQQCVWGGPGAAVYVDTTTFGKTPDYTWPSS